MRTPLFPTIFALLTLIVFIAAQTVNLLPSNLPACAQQCTILTQAQGSCTPPLAPVTTDTIYESCFCQSALLTSLYSNTNAQLCTSCSSTDMATIQQWYQGVCPDNGRGAPNFGTLATGPTTTSVATGPTTTSSVTTANSGTSNQQDPTTSTNPAPEGSWISTHWRWVVMLFIIVLGLSALAIGGWFFHRRYHRRREAKWSNALGAPDITTWGPGQSVHDLGYYGSGAGSAPGAYGEKAKAKEQTRGVNEPPPARMKENRLSKF